MFQCTNPIIIVVILATTCVNFEVFITENFKYLNWL
uniref:Uncharacterized protein n=1 Tax=Glossina palpalis gambiensis TaxID=67801 RepID=A0A1B0C6E3_9MUSC